jgi:hypothetical protein
VAADKAPDTRSAPLLGSTLLARAKGYFMGKTMVTLAIVAVLGLGGAGLYLGTRESSAAVGELSEALLRVPSDATALTAVFSQYLPADMALSERQALLDKNGFRCSVEAANVEGSRYLRCLRPTQNSGYCQGINYYAYETADGEIIETLGSPYDANRERNLLGQCDGPRQEYHMRRGSAD